MKRTLNSGSVLMKYCIPFYLILSIVSFASAQTTISPIFPLTRSEQAGRINEVVNGNHGGRFDGLRNPQVFSSKPYIQRDYSAQYQLASQSERRAISERVGNQAAARYAAERNWERLLGSMKRSIPQGPDSVYWDPVTARVRAIERKGGTSRLGFNYFAQQGTNKYHIRAAMRVLKSEKTTFNEKLVSARVIDAAQRGRLESAAVRGGRFGQPVAPVLDTGWDRSVVRNEAIEIERRLIRGNPELRNVFKEAKSANSGGILKYRIGQGLGVLGLSGAGVIALDAYGQTFTALEMWNDPNLSGSTTPYLQSGLAAGKWLEAGTLGLYSTANLGFWGQGSLKLFGQAVGKGFLPVAFISETLSSSIAIYDYKRGRISNQQFERQMIGTGIFATCTGGGAAIGSVIPGAGTAAGAGVGAIVGGIVQGGMHLHWHFVDKKTNAEQKRIVEAATYEHYNVMR